MSGWNFRTDPVKNVVVSPRVFSKEECKKIISIGDTIGWESASYIPKRDEVVQASKGSDVRDSETVFIHPCPETFWIFERMTSTLLDVNQNFFGFHLSGFTEGFQLTRYEAPTGHYDFHIDKWEDGPIRKLSSIVNLSSVDDYEGGEFVVKTSQFEVPYKEDQGSVVTIPSFILHRVNPVTKGTRYSLVAWVSGDPFK